MTRPNPSRFVALAKWVLPLLLIVGAIVWAFRPRPVTVETALVARNRFEQTIEEEGHTRVRSRYTIASPVAGTAGRVDARVGDEVTPGQFLVAIRPSPPALTDARALAQLRERLGASEAADQRALANIARARAALAQARADFERARELANQGFTARSNEESSRLLLEQQKQALTGAEYEREAARHEVAMARAALAQSDMGTAAQSLTNEMAAPAVVEVRAPVGGRILKLLHESENAVEPGTPLMEIGDVRALEAVVPVLSTDAIVISPGAPVRLRAGRDETTFEGSVVLVEPVAETKVSSLGVEEQRVRVIIAFDVPAGGPQIGDRYSVDASIVTLARDDVITVPIGALVRGQQDWFAYVAEQGVARRRIITVGGRNARSAWIVAGLEVGERVIVYPPDTVTDGAQLADRQ